MGNCCSSVRDVFCPANRYESIPENDSRQLSNSVGGQSKGNSSSYQSQPSSKAPPTAVGSSKGETSKAVEIIPIGGNNQNNTFNMNNSDARSIAVPVPGSLKSAFYMSYELKEEIGVGSTSKCYRCVRKSDQKHFACKVIDKRQVELKFSGLLEQFYVEINVLKALNHPNIIHLEDTFESADRIYMVMELMDGGELFDYVVEKGTLSEEEASILVRKITSAVAHMHGQNIIHRDLKPENLLLTNKGLDAEVKLIDFGLAKVMYEPVASSFLGTKGYLAPEMLQRHSYDKAIDMWALGVIVFVLLCGCLPFDDDSSRIASDAAARKKFALRFPKWASTLSASAKDLLHNLLEINPKNRFTAEQALNHPWVSGRTVQSNSFLQSPQILGDRRKDMRNDFQNVVSQGAVSANVAHSQPGTRQPETSVTYYGRSGNDPKRTNGQ
jgi:serine/threonine protein kinase